MDARWKKPTSQKQNFSSLTLKDAMQLIGLETLISWNIDAPPRPVGETLKELLRRFASFDLQSSESAKTLLIDAHLWRLFLFTPT